MYHKLAYGLQEGVTISAAPTIQLALEGRR